MAKLLFDGLVVVELFVLEHEHKSVNAIKEIAIRITNFIK
jgi:hypothetical protein